MKARHNKLLILFFLTFLFSTSLIYIWHISKSLPEELYIYSNKDTVVNLDIPVTGVIKVIRLLIFQNQLHFRLKKKPTILLNINYLTSSHFHLGNYQFLKKIIYMLADFQLDYILKLMVYL